MQQVEQVEEMNPQAETNKSLSTLNKYARGEAPPLGGAQVPGPYEGLAAAMAAELMIDFWFGIGAILAIKIVSSLEELISRK